MNATNASQIALNDVAHAFANAIALSIICAFVALFVYAIARIIAHERYLMRCRRDERARSQRRRHINVTYK